MKTIVLKTLEMDNKSDFEYKDHLLNLLRVKPDGGMDLVEMEKALGIIGKLRRANGSVTLEDAEHQYLAERVNAQRWSIADPAIVSFIKDVRDAQAPQEEAAPSAATSDA